MLMDGIMNIMELSITLTLGRIDNASFPFKRMLLTRCFECGAVLNTMNFSVPESNLGAGRERGAGQ